MIITDIKWKKDTWDRRKNKGQSKRKKRKVQMKKRRKRMTKSLSCTIYTWVTLRRMRAA